MYIRRRGQRVEVANEKQRVEVTKNEQSGKYFKDWAREAVAAAKQGRRPVAWGWDNPEQLAAKVYAALSVYPRGASVDDMVVIAHRLGIPEKLALAFAHQLCRMGRVRWDFDRQSFELRFRAAA